MTIYSSFVGPFFRVIGGMLTDANTTMNTAIVDSRLVLNGSSHEFVPSTLHDAIYVVAGRLLRPIWFRPIIANGVISELWTAPLIHQVTKPILELMKIIQG